MVIVTIIAAFILAFSFIGGCVQGLTKSFFSLIGVIIAIPVAGRFYSFFAGLLDFLHNRDWQNFIGFFIASIIASIILGFVFFFPRKILEKTWPEGFGFRLIGGLFNFVGATISIVVFTSVVTAFPIWDWLRLRLVESPLINWLMVNLNFIQSLLPEILRFPHNPTI